MVTTWRLAGHRTRATHATHVSLCHRWTPSSPGNRCLRLPSGCCRCRCPNAVSRIHETHQFGHPTFRNSSIKKINLATCHMFLNSLPSNGGSDNDARQARQGNVEAYSLQRSSQRQRGAQEPSRPGETVDEEGQGARQDLSVTRNAQENTRKYTNISNNSEKHFAIYFARND